MVKATRATRVVEGEKEISTKDMREEHVDHMVKMVGV